MSNEFTHSHLGSSRRRVVAGRRRARRLAAPAWAEPRWRFGRDRARRRLAWRWTAPPLVARAGPGLLRFYRRRRETLHPTANARRTDAPVPRSRYRRNHLGASLRLGLATQGCLSRHLCDP